MFIKKSLTGRAHEKIILSGPPNLSNQQIELNRRATTQGEVFFSRLSERQRVLLSEKKEVQVRCDDNALSPFFVFRSLLFITFACFRI